MHPRVWSIEVMNETDDESVVEATVEAIREQMCGPEHELGADHRCDPPWFIVSGPCSPVKARRWRSLLNR